MLRSVLRKKIQKRPKSKKTSRKKKTRFENQKLSLSTRLKKRPRLQPKVNQLESKELVKTAEESSSQDQSVVLVENPTQVIPTLEQPKIPGVITNQELLTPNENLKSSIEGFILDQRSEHTKEAYLKDLKRFLNFLRIRKFKRKEENKNPIEVVDRLVFIAYKDFLLNEKLEHTTIDRHLASLRSVFHWIVEDGIIEKNPVERVRFLNPKKISKTAGLSDEEVQKVLKQPNLHTKTGAQHYAILMVLFYCGIRRSELCSIRLSNLTKEREIWVLRLKGKGNKERIIPLIASVMNAIRYYLFISRRTLSEQGYLFTPIRNNRTGVLKKSLDPSMIYYIVQRYAKMAGLTFKVSPHSCRATAISNARDHQVSDRAIQEFAGWASTDMITRYDKRKTAIEDSAAHSIEYGKESESRLPNYEGASLEQLLADQTDSKETQSQSRPLVPKL